MWSPKPLQRPRSHPSPTLGRLRAPLLILALAGTACASAPPDTGLQPEPESGLYVLVDNQHDRDVRVYVVRGSTQVGLGSVGSFETRRFRVGGALLGPSGFLELVARPLGGSAVAHMQPTVVQAGQRVDWRLGTNLRHSTVLVR